jgi:mono/diheme cytochrome c family protein
MPFSRKTARFGLSALMAVMVLAAQAGAQEDPDPARGKRIYRGTCIACHSPTGKGGIPGTPDFTRGDGVLSQDDSVLTDHIRNGFRSKGSAMPMPAKGANPKLTDQDIQNVLAYLHEEFGEGN